jgi:hypothetical protein
LLYGLFPAESVSRNLAVLYYNGQMNEFDLSHLGSFSLSSSRRGIVLDANFIPMLYHNVNGEILEVTGLKGKLGIAISHALLMHSLSVESIN